jgi:lipopolysaccharide heptosyltransferase II
MKKTVSIIIPTYNRASMLPRAIESVLRQDYPDVEIIVIDDCSQDDTANVVRGYDDKRLRYIRLPENMGVAAARNFGIKSATGDFIAFLDSDDEFMPGKIERQVRVFELVSPRPGMVITNYWNKGDISHLIIDADVPSGFVSVENKFPADIFNGPPSWMLSRECVEKVGLFDEELRTLEDLDYFARAVRAMPVYYLNEPLSLIHVHNFPAGRAPDDFSEYTRRRILAKWMPQMKLDRRFLSDFYYVAGKDLVRAHKPYKAIPWLWRALVADYHNGRVLRKFFQAFLRWFLLSINWRVGENGKRFRKYNSIMIINPYGIGDVLFSTPLIRNLHEAYPQAKIFYLSNQRTEFVLRDNPLIDKIFVYDRDAFVRTRRTSILKWIKKHLELLSEIRRERVELAVDLSLNSFFGIIALVAGIKTRVGLDYHKRGKFLTKKRLLEGFDDKHVAEYYLDLLGTMGLPLRKTGLEIYTNVRSREWADKLVRNHCPPSSGPLIGIAPLGGETWGKHAFRKRWPAAHFAGLIDKIIDKYNAKILIYGGAKDEKELMDIISKVKNRKACHMLVGYSFEQVIASIDKCDLFISNDTGLLRFADALGKKIIAFFGPVDEKVYGMFPFDQQRHIYMKKDLPCRPCYKRFRLGPCDNDIACLKEVTVDDTMLAVEKLLAGKNQDNRDKLLIKDIK